MFYKLKARLLPTHDAVVVGLKYKQLDGWKCSTGDNCILFPKGINCCYSAPGKQTHCTSNFSLCRTRKAEKWTEEEDEKGSLISPCLITKVVISFPKGIRFSKAALTLTAPPFTPFISVICRVWASLHLSSSFYTFKLFHTRWEWD